MPNARWDTINVDFVIKLLELLEYDAVITVVDLISKRVHFIPTHTTITAESTTRLFLHYM